MAQSDHIIEIIIQTIVNAFQSQMSFEKKCRQCRGKIFEKKIILLEENLRATNEKI